MNSIHWILLLVGLVEGRTFLKVTQQFAEEAIKASVECSEKLGLPVNMLDKFLSFNFEDSQSMREYIYCLGITVGVNQEDGSLKHTLAKYAGNDKRRNDVIKTIDECNKVDAIDKYEMAYKVCTCYLSKSPLLFKI